MVVENASESIYVVRQVLLDHFMELHIAHSGSDEALRRELKKNAKTRSSLVHSSIPPVHDFGVCTNGDPFMIIELPGGERLDSLIESAAAISVPNAVFIAWQVGSAMLLLDEHELRYGKISAEQIVIASDGVPALINLGFSNCAKQPPQQSDVVRSIGRILLEMLNGSRQHATLFDTAAMQLHSSYLDRNDLGDLADDLRSFLEGTLLKKRTITLEHVCLALAAMLERSDWRGSTRQGETREPFLVFGVVTVFALTVSIIATCLMPRIETPKLSFVSPSPPAQTLLIPKKFASDNQLVSRLAEQGGVDGRLVLRDLSVDDQGLRCLKGAKVPIARLDLSDTLVSDVSMSYICHFPLLYLDITRDNITDAGLKVVCDHCPQLVNLRIGNTRITAKGLEYLFALKNLQGLNLHNNGLNDDAMIPIARLIRLQKIDLENNAAITDKGLARLSKRNSLKNINLTGTAVTDAGMVALLNLKNLDTLYLGNTNSITDDALKILVHHRQLKRITFRRTKVTERGLLTLLQSRNLVELNLPGMTVSDSIRKAFLKRNPEFKITTAIMSKLQQ